MVSSNALRRSLRDGPLAWHRVRTAHAADFAAAVNHEDLGVREDLLQSLEYLRRNHVPARGRVPHALERFEVCILAANVGEEPLQQARPRVENRDLGQCAREGLGIHDVGARQDAQGRAAHERREQLEDTDAEAEARERRHHVAGPDAVTPFGDAYVVPKIGLARHHALRRSGAARRVKYRSWLVSGRWVFAVPFELGFAFGSASEDTASVMASPHSNFWQIGASARTSAVGIVQDGEDACVRIAGVHRDVHAPSSKSRAARRQSRATARGRRRHADPTHPTCSSTCAKRFARRLSAP